MLKERGEAHILGYDAIPGMEAFVHTSSVREAQAEQTSVAEDWKPSYAVTVHGSSNRILTSVNNLAEAQAEQRAQ